MTPTSARAPPRAHFKSRVAFAFAIVVLAACGGGESKAERSRAEWVKEANPLCATARDKSTPENSVELATQLIADLRGLGIPDDEVGGAIDAFKAALATPEGRSDSDALAEIGKRFDAIGADDCGRLFVAGD